MNVTFLARSTLFTAGNRRLWQTEKKKTKKREPAAKAYDKVSLRQQSAHLAGGRVQALACNDKELTTAATCVRPNKESSSARVSHRRIATLA